MSLNEHFRSDHIAAWRDRWPTLGIGERRLHLFDVRESEPI